MSLQFHCIFFSFLEAMEIKSLSSVQCTPAHVENYEIDALSDN